MPDSSEGGPTGPRRGLDWVDFLSVLVLLAAISAAVATAGLHYLLAGELLFTVVSFTTLQLRMESAERRGVGRGSENGVVPYLLAATACTGLVGSYLAVSTELGQALTSWIVADIGRLVSSVLVSLVCVPFLDHAACGLRMHFSGSTPR